MIKINLAKASASVAVESQSVASSGLATAAQSDVAVKVVLMLIFVMGIYGFEKYNISGKTQRLVAIERERQALTTKVAQYGAVTTVVEDLAKERKKLSKQMQVIQQISKKRAFKLQSITQLQVAMPVDSWIEELNLADETVKFKGYSKSPASVQGIVAKLSELDFMQNVQTKEMAIKKIGKNEVHEFNIEAKVMK